jgi:hypothetical protein
MKSTDMKADVNAGNAARKRRARPAAEASDVFNKMVGDLAQQSKKVPDSDGYRSKEPTQVLFKFLLNFFVHSAILCGNGEAFFF